jgi:hypothetical protein
MSQKIILDISGNNAVAIGFNSIMSKLSDPDFRLLHLINDSSFEFKNEAYSSRMLNHYEKNGWIVADRNNPIGKRKFSLAGMLFLNLNVKYHGLLADCNLKFNNEFDVKLNSYSFLQTISHAQITPFDLLVLLSVLLYKVDLVSLSVNKEKDSIRLSIDGANKTYLISSEIFQYLEKYSLEKRGYIKHKLSKQSDDFFTEFVYLIDELRNEIGTNLICPNLYSQMKGKSILIFNQGHRRLVAETTLFSMGESIMSQIQNAEREMVVDEYGNCYSIDVKYLGKASFIRKISGGRKIETLQSILKSGIEK